MRVRIRVPRRRPKKLVARARRSGRMLLITCGFALGSSLYALIGENGLGAVLEMRARARQLRYEIGVKQAANQTLRDEIRPLREEDPQAIEKLAREQLMMARPGDTVYVLPAQPDPQSAAPETSPREDPASPTAPSLPLRR